MSENSFKGDYDQKIMNDGTPERKGFASSATLLSFISIAFFALPLAKE